MVWFTPVESFNSTLVQLKGWETDKVPNPDFSFNSTLVQLKALRKPSSQGLS